MEKDTLAEFIDLYKQRPCLWNNRSANYANKKVRLSALEELLKILKKIDPSANIASVRAKIDSLRTNYNREKKKVLISTSTGSSTDEIYVPSLWYYPLLDFLSDTADLKRTGSDSIDSSSTSRVGSAAKNLDETGTPPPPPNKKVKKKSAQQKILKIAEQVANQRDNVEELDEFDSFGRFIAMGLKKLKHPHQSIAQKLMSDVIFLAKMGRLAEDSTIYNLTRLSHSNVQSQCYDISRSPTPQFSDSNSYEYSPIPNP